MSSLKCPKCGVPSTGLCPKCYIADHPIGVKPLKIIECTCGMVCFQGTWTRDRKQALKTLVEKSIKPPSEINAYVGHVDWEEEAGEMRLKAQITGRYKKQAFEDELKFSIRPKKTTCEACRKQGSGYFEAVLQIRDKDLFIKVDQEQLCGMTDVKGGHDIYLISHEYARLKTSELGEKGYLIKHSKKLFTKRDGKEVFRYYYSIKHPPFQVGEFLKVKNRIARVDELGRNSKLTDVRTGKKFNARMTHLLEAEKIATQLDVKTAIVTEIRPDGVQIMDEADYSTHELPHKEGLEPGQQVKILIVGKKYILI